MATAVKIFHRDCPQCYGTGTYHCETRGINGPCPSCDGTGGSYPKWKYEPSGDSDGEHAFTDHFVMDENGDEIGCPPGEHYARLMAAAPSLLEALENLLRETADGTKPAPGGLWATEARKVVKAARGIPA